jgi:hypothetical protein
MMDDVAMIIGYFVIGFGAGWLVATLIAQIFKI